MAYEKTNWKDHAVENPNRYTISENSDGTVEIIRTHGQVLQQGTAVNAARLNKIENGIANATQAAEQAADGVAQLTNNTNANVGALQAAIETERDRITTANNRLDGVDSAITALLPKENIKSFVVNYNGTGINWVASGGLYVAEFPVEDVLSTDIVIAGIDIYHSTAANLKENAKNAGDISCIVVVDGTLKVWKRTNATNAFRILGVRIRK